MQVLNLGFSFPTLPFGSQRGVPPNLVRNDYGLQVPPSISENLLSNTYSQGNLSRQPPPWPEELQKARLVGGTLKNGPTSLHLLVGTNAVMTSSRTDSWPDILTFIVMCHGKDGHKAFDYWRWIDRKCVAMTACSKGTYQTTLTDHLPYTANTACAVCEGNEYQDEIGQTACKQHSAECLSTQFQYQSATLTTDRFCAFCTSCLSSSHYTVRGCTATEDTICSPLTRCPAGSYVEPPRRPNEDNRCTPCAAGTYQPATSHVNTACLQTSLCGPGEYQSRLPWADVDRNCSICPPFTWQPSSEHANTECRPWRTCTALERDVAAGSRTSDRMCVALGADCAHDYSRVGDKCVPQSVSSGCSPTEYLGGVQLVCQPDQGGLPSLELDAGWRSNVIKLVLAGRNLTGVDVQVLLALPWPRLQSLDLSGNALTRWHDLQANSSTVPESPSMLVDLRSNPALQLPVTSLLAYDTILLSPDMSQGVSDLQQEQLVLAARSTASDPNSNIQPLSTLSKCISVSGRENGKISICTAPPCSVCSAGTFDTPSGCTTCDAGGFYQSRAGFVAAASTSHCGCQACPDGTFSSAPGGMSVASCQKCPSGTNATGSAGYRPLILTGTVRALRCVYM